MLRHVDGCGSFEELRKDINDTNLIHGTYTAACFARGLYADDQEWHKIMTDAANTQKPKQMRHCFALLWVYEKPKDPMGLWEQFKIHLSEDYTYHRTMHDEDKSWNIADVYNAALDVKQILLDMHQNEESLLLLHQYLQGFNDSDVLHAHCHREEIQNDAEFNDDERRQPTAEEIHTRIQKMSDHQRNILETIIESILNPQSPNRQYFLTAAGGYGKTTVTKVLID